MPADLILVLSPLAGGALNLASQLILARQFAGERLLSVVAAAFGLGFVATIVLALYGLSLGGSAFADAVALMLSVIIVYCAFGLVLFAIVNLGETSLRIRMMRILLGAPDGLSRAQLMSGYDDRKLVAIRLQRVLNKRQARYHDGVYYRRVSFLFAAAAGVGLLKWIIYGARR